MYARIKEGSQGRRRVVGKIRKQVYLDPEQDEKLRSFAARWARSEAGIIRIAVDRLRDEDVLAADLEDEPNDEDAALTDEEIEALEAENETWFREHPQSLRPSEAVSQEREGS
jgi:hypothetical protein